MLTEPPRTAYDLSFQLAGIPVRVHPFFWLAAVILGSRGLEGPNAGMSMLIWVTVMFVSILVHELGHSFVIRFFGQSPRIVLYMMGGLAITDSGFGSFYGGSHRTSRNQILISLAGPGAGFLLAVLTVMLVYALGGTMFWNSSRFPFFGVVVPDGTSEAMVELIWDLLWLNIFWGIVNLLPVFPLDGGQIAREVFQLADPQSGLLRSLWLSVFTAAGIAILGGVLLKSMLMAVFFGSLAVSAYMMIQQMTGRGGYGGRPW